MNATLVPSRTEAAARILVVRDVERGTTRP
jgi:hypothetical protein